MNTTLLPFPMRGRLLALVAPVTLLPALFEQVAGLAHQGPLSVLDAGNVFQGYSLARGLARFPAGENLHAGLAPGLQRVQLARVFTCYQMATLLSEMPPADHPVLVLDLLSTFYDQGVRVADRRRLLHACLRQLQALSRAVPVAVWVRQRSVIPEEGLEWIRLVERAAGQVWRPERRPAPVCQQLALFG